MRPEDEILLACTRQDFHPEHQARVHDISSHKHVRWEIVYTTALDHGVAPLIYANLRRCGWEELGIPQDVMAQFQLIYFQNMSYEEGRRQNLLEALALFKAMDIQVMLVKGAALDALVYRDPYLTMPQDVDLVLRVRKNELGEKELRTIGDSLHQKGIEFDFFEHHDVTMNNIFPVDFNRIWADAQNHNIENYEVSIMCPEDLLLTACINSCRKRFFRLKSMCDVAEIIKKYHELNWQSFIDNSIADECNYIVYTALLVTKRLLDCSYQEDILADLKVGRARFRLIRFLIENIRERRTLASLFPFSGVKMFGREIEPSLLLTYASYRNYQIGRKLQEVYRAWQRKEGYLV
jgi:hypothetical protein